MGKIGDFIKQDQANREVKKRYKQERDYLLSNRGSIPSPFFCEEFTNRLETGWELADEAGYGGRDAEDYHAWGYALFGDVEYNAEDEVNSIGIFSWHQLYQAVEEGNHKEAAESLEEIMSYHLPEKQFVALSPTQMGIVGMALHSTSFEEFCKETEEGQTGEYPKGPLPSLEEVREIFPDVEPDDI